MVLNKGESVDWDDYLTAFASGIGTKHPYLCDSAYIAQKIFGLRMPEDFKYYGRGGIRSDMLCRDLALHWLASARGNKSEGRINSKYKPVFKIGKLLSKYDSKALRSVALYLWNGNKGAADLAPKEVEKSREIVKKLKKAKKASLS